MEASRFKDRDTVAGSHLPNAVNAQADAPRDSKGSHTGGLSLIGVASEAGDQHRPPQTYNNSKEQSMIINLTPQWRISVDHHGNHTPERYVKRKGGKTTPSGKPSKPFEGWESTNKYMSTVQQAINWIATNDCMGEDYDSLKAYHADFERRISELLEGLK